MNKNYKIIFTAILFLIGLNCPGQSAGTPDVCNNKTPNELQDLLNNWSTQAQYGRTSINTEIAACMNKFKDLGIDQCFKNIQMYTDTVGKTRRAGHSAGFTIPDAQYTQEINKRNPELLKIPDEFKDGLPSNWKEIADQKAYKYLEYRSGSVSNPPYGDFSRILFYINKPNIDQWVQITVPDRSESGTKPSLINIIGVEKKSRATDGRMVRMDQPGFSFAEYQYDREGKNPRYRGFEYSCVTCHPSGPRNVVPVAGSVSPEQKHTLTEMNQTMKDYQSTNFYYLDPDAMGPHRGSKQGCTDCHNNYTDFGDTPRGALTSGTEMSSVRHKMLVEFSMPPGLKNRPNYKSFFDAMAKADSLDEEQRKLLMSRLPNAGDDQNRVILNHLVSTGKISQEEFDKANLSLQEMYQAQREKFSKIQEDFSSQMSEWLKGDKNQCVLSTLTPSANQTTREPAAPSTVPSSIPSSSR